MQGFIIECGEPLGLFFGSRAFPVLLRPLGRYRWLMGEAEEPPRAQTLLSDAHIDVQKQAKKSGALDKGRDTGPPIPKHATVEAG